MPLMVRHRDLQRCRVAQKLVRRIEDEMQRKCGKAHLQVMFKLLKCHAMIRGEQPSRILFKNLMSPEHR